MLLNTEVRRQSSLEHGLALMTKLGITVWNLPATYRLPDKDDPEGQIIKKHSEILFFGQNDSPAQFAVKTYRAGPGGIKDVEMIAKEAAVLGNLDHPHIIKSPGILTLPDGRFGPILPVVDTDLSERLSHEDFTREKILEILTPISDALEYSHSLGILHLDIKPSNIFFAGNTQLLGDFGGCSMPEIDSTHSMGTELYNAPEQQFSPNPTGKDNYHPYTDSYQFALMIYRIFSDEYGEYPFTDENGGRRSHPLAENHILAANEHLPEESLVLNHLRAMTGYKIESNRVPVDGIPSAIRYALLVDTHNGVLDPNTHVPRKPDYLPLAPINLDNEVSLEWLMAGYDETVKMESNTKRFVPPPIINKSNVAAPFYNNWGDRRISYKSGKDVPAPLFNTPIK